MLSLVTVSPVITAFHSCCLSHHVFWPSKPLAGLGRIWNRYLLTMLTWNRRDSTPLSAAPRAPKTTCLKVTQCSTSEMGDALLYNSCSLPIQVMTDRTIAGLPRITGTCPGWWKQSFRQRLWSLVWFQARATSCHLTSSKSAWKSTPKCTSMCWRVWWSPGAMRWPVQTLGVAAGLIAGPQVQRDPGLASEGVLQFCTLLSLVPLLNRPELLDYFVWSYVENITNMTSHNAKARLIAAIHRVFTELPPALVEKACSQFWIRIEAVIEAEGGYIE